MPLMLYRFRPFNQHTITELLTEKLHFTHPNTWNDPFEMYDMKKISAFNVRYNCKGKYVYQILLKLIRNNPLKLS